MLAALPMYDWPEVRTATDAWWSGIAGHLRAEGFRNVPDALTREPDVYRLWRDPGLVLGQTCGYPLTHELDGDVRVVGTPCYGVEGCEEATYSSAIVVRRRDAAAGLDGLRGKRAAYNTPDSMSGNLALRIVFSRLAGEGRFFGEAICSGGHHLSLEMVRDGTADVAAIDCVTLALARRYRPKLVKGLEVISRSPKVPALPYVTRTAWSPAEFARLRRALQAAFADPALSQSREALFLAGLEPLSRADYDIILRLESDADARGYARLA